MFSAAVETVCKDERNVCLVRALRVDCPVRVRDCVFSSCVNQSTYNNVGGGLCVVSHLHSEARTRQKHVKHANIKVNAMCLEFPAAAAT